MSDQQPASGDDPQRIKEQLAGDKRDIADLWNEALRRYKLIVGVELTPTPTNGRAALSVDEMVQFGTEQMNKFHKFRHDAKKVDRLRGLLKDNLDYIEEGAKQLVGAATPAFPPAAAIGTALTLLLTACRQVSADYDVVTAFFEDMNSFLQRTTILQSRLPDYPAYRNCLMDVFTALLEMCGFATKYIELGRFKKWIINLFNGEDGELADARKKMDTSLSRLQSATEFAILGNTEEIQRMNADLKQNQEEQVKRMEEQSRLLERVLDRQDSVRTELSDIRKLLLVFNETKAASIPKEGGINKSRNHSTPKSRIRSVFEATGYPICEYSEIKESLANESPRIFLVSGPPGIGKSHLAAASFDKLVQLATQSPEGPRSATYVAQFYFRAIDGGASQFCEAINWITIQIAEQNAALGEIIGLLMETELDRGVDLDAWHDIWDKFIQPFFCTPGEKSRLYIVLDGLDELEKKRDIQALRDFLQLVQETPGLRVGVLCTARTAFVPKLEPFSSACTSISVTRDKILLDVKTVIWHHLNTDGRLRHLSRQTKQSLADRLEKESDGMLYAEHMLRHFHSMGRESLIARQLGKPLPVGIEGLYSAILANMQHRTLPDKLPVLKGLLAWLSFCLAPLSLADCLSLQKLIPGGPIDFDEELQHPPLERFLKIGAADEQLQDPAAQAVSEIETLTRTDYTAPLDDRTHPVKFRERSMREYFRSAGLEETTAGLRTPKRAAQALILRTCSRILTGNSEGVEGTINRRLQIYAAQCWIRHMHSWMTCWEDAGDDDEEKITTLEAVGAILTNQHHVAKLLVSLNVDYRKIYGHDAHANQWQILLKSMRYVASKAVDLAPKLSERTLRWAKMVVKSRWAALLPLARGYVIAWFRSRGFAAALNAYKLAKSMIALTSYRHLVDSAADDGDESNSDDDNNVNDPDSEDSSSEKEILGISHAFSDIRRDADAYWAIAAVLAHFSHYSSALQLLQEALSLGGNNGTERFRLLALMASIQHLARDMDGAVSSITLCLSNRDVEPEYLRNALQYRAQIHAYFEHYEQAAESYREARLADPATPFPGELLKDEFSMYQLGVGAGMEPVNIVKEWTPLERLTWMTWDYDNDASQHSEFTQSCGRTGEHEFMVRAYEEAIELLDRIDSSAPIRYRLALAHWRVRGDAAAARACLDAILDTTSSGSPYWLTDEDTTFTLGSIVELLTGIIIDEFRCSADPAAKVALLENARSIMNRNLAKSVTLLRSERVDLSVCIALMLRVMGPATEYELVLKDAFSTSFEMIPSNLSSGDVGWPLFSLARIISLMGGFEREAEILASAAYSGIPTAREHVSSIGSDDENDEADENDSGNEDAGATCCQGECTPIHCWNSWEDGPMYICLICSSRCQLCDPCYRRRQTYNDTNNHQFPNKGDSTSLRPMYCGVRHRYVQAPVAGWRRVKGDILRIDGEEEIDFREWLNDLKENKWKQAWHRFWLTDI